MTPPVPSCTGNRHCSSILVATHHSAAARAGVGASAGARAELSSVDDSFLAACWRFLVDTIRHCHRCLLLPRHAALVRFLLLLSAAT